MRYLLSIAWNTLKVDFSQRGTYISVLILPLIFTLVIGVAGSGLGKNGGNRIPVALVDHDGGALAQAFAETLNESGELVVISVDEETAMQYLQDLNVVAVAVLPPGFTADLQSGGGVTIQLHYFEMNTLAVAAREAIQPAVARVARSALAAQISVVEAESMRPFASQSERQAYFARSLEIAEEQAAKDPVLVQLVMAEETVSLNPVMGFKSASPGQLVTWLLFTLMAGSVVLVGERRDGTLRRLLATPAPRWSILGGKLLGRFTLGMIQAAVLVLFGQFALGVEWGNSPLGMAMVTVCFGLAATALGLLLSTLARTGQQASTISLLGMFLLAPLGGAWFPLEITPRAFQQAVQALPTTWAMRGYLDVILRAKGPEDVLVPCGILLAFAAVFFFAGLLRFRYD
jgi:ABC-2 type transport system permease protein